MTNQEKQQLSRDVASKYGIEPYEITFIPLNHVFSMNDSHTQGYDKIVWLHDDSARCFDLMVEHEIDINNYGNWVMAVSDTGDYREYTKDHDNDKAMTARIAGLKALLAKGE